MPTIPELVRHLHTQYDITKRSPSVVNFGVVGPVRRNTAVKQLKAILLDLASVEGWVDVLKAIASSDKKWEAEFSDHLMATASGGPSEGVVSTDLGIKLWVDIDSNSTQDENRIVLEDTASGRISKIKFGTYQALTSKNDMAAARYEMGLCQVVYEKTRDEPSWDVRVEGSAEGKVYQVRQFNTHCSPPWARASIEGVDLSKPPAEMQAFLEHLLSPNLEQIELLFSWQHYAQTARAPTVLTMSGNKGVGKSIQNLLISSLFSNPRPAPKNFFSTDFNAPFLKENPYCYIDEFPGEDLVALRKYMNKEQMLEAKNQGSTYCQIGTNFSISTNPENVMRIEPDERIFSVLDLTKRDLREVWTEARINDFVKAFSPESMDPVKTHFFHFIRNYIPKYTAAYVWKGPRFLELVIEGLSDWKAFLREECLRTIERTGLGGELPITKIRKEYRAKRSLKSSGGSLFSRDKTAHFLLKMAEAGDVLGTFIETPYQHILVGIDPRDDIGAL